MIDSKVLDRERPLKQTTSTIGTESSTSHEITRVMYASKVHALCAPTLMTISPTKLQCFLVFLPFDLVALTLLGVGVG